MFISVCLIKMPSYKVSLLAGSILFKQNKTCSAEKRIIGENSKAEPVKRLNIRPKHITWAEISILAEVQKET